MSGFTTSATLAEMINKRPIRKRRRNVKKKKKKKSSKKIKIVVCLKNIFQV
tara:strand:+ start:145 stop:297 length:153 start_codon:yes stop_codon:yes gene_type:complete